MGQRRKFSAEYKREAVAMLESPGVTVNQIAAELGIEATVLGRWRRELRQWPVVFNPCVCYFRATSTLHYEKTNL